MRAIGPPLSDAEVASWIAAARSRIGDPWRHQARGAGLRGVDCAGLLLWAMARVPRPTVDVSNYGRLAYRGALEKAMRDNFGPPLHPSEMRAGDGVVMKFRNGEPAHVGILGNHPYGGLSIIHAYAKTRGVVEHRLDEEWASRIMEVYRP